MTDILSQEPGEDIIEIVNLLASNRTDELRINYPKAAAKIDKLLQAIQRTSPGKYFSRFWVSSFEIGSSLKCTVIFHVGFRPRTGNWRAFKIQTHYPPLSQAVRLRCK